MQVVATRLRRSDTQLRRAIAELDLSLIKMKLVDTKDGPGWTSELADRVEPVYKHHLFLNGKYADRDIVPTKLVDTFWHQHILDTRKYAKDCKRMFGGFLHHFPYFGLRGEEDAANLKASFAETQRLYELEFGVTLFTALAQPSDTPMYCSGNSCSGKCSQSCSSRRSPPQAFVPAEVKADCCGRCSDTARSPVADCTSGSCSKSCSGCTGGGDSSCSGCK